MALTFLSRERERRVNAGRDASRINAWIIALIRCNVQELNHGFGRLNGHMHPLAAFSVVKHWQNLPTSSLKSPSIVSFTNLKVLTLEQIDFVDDG